MRRSCIRFTTSPGITILDWFSPNLAPVVEAILESGYPCDLTSAVMLGKLTSVPVLIGRAAIEG